MAKYGQGFDADIALRAHLIPPPESPAEAAAFLDDLRRGGYRGEVTVGDDLVTITVPASEGT